MEAASPSVPTQQNAIGQAEDRCTDDEVKNKPARGSG